MPQVLTQAMNGEVELHDYEAEIPTASTVLVRFLAAPINPLDVLVLSGSYPVKPTHKHKGLAVPGYDGIAEVVECGENVTDPVPGDMVVPSKFGVGTWRSEAILDASSLQKIPQPKDLFFGAILKISVLPAYFLIEDMAKLKPGDWIIQNAATSVISQMVIQFARLKGLRCISVIRSREIAEATRIKQLLKALGAEMVFTEDELLEQSSSITTKPVKLALDSVFGPSARLLANCLAVGGTFVQLGFLGGATQQLLLSNKDLFVRQLQFRGFRGSTQLAQRTPNEQLLLLSWLVELFNDGTLVLPPLGLDKVEWNTTDEQERNAARLLSAVSQAKTPTLGQKKQIIVFT